MPEGLDTSSYQDSDKAYEQVLCGNLLRAAATGFTDGQVDDAINDSPGPTSGAPVMSSFGEGLRLPRPGDDLAGFIEEVNAHAAGIDTTSEGGLRIDESIAANTGPYAIQTHTPKHTDHTGAHYFVLDYADQMRRVDDVNKETLPPPKDLDKKIASIYAKAGQDRIERPANSNEIAEMIAAYQGKAVLEVLTREEQSKDLTTLEQARSLALEQERWITLVDEVLGDPYETIQKKVAPEKENIVKAAQAPKEPSVNIATLIEPEKSVTPAEEQATWVAFVDKTLYNRS